MKQILKEWKNFVQIEESRTWTQSLNQFNQSLYSDSANVQSNDRTNLSAEAFVKEILMLVSSKKDKQLSVSFVNKYDADNPRLGVSPFVEFDTPHGVYGYPLSGKNVYRLLTTGMATYAGFATERNFMHIYEIANSDEVNDRYSITINRDYTTNYKNSNFKKDVLNLTKMFLSFILNAIDENRFTFLSGMNARTFEDDYPEFESNPVKYMTTSSDDSFHLEGYKRLFTFIYKCYTVDAMSQREIEQKLMNVAIKLSLSSDNKFADRISKGNSRFYQVYYIARLYSLIAENFHGRESGDYSTSGVMGGLFLTFINGIGIESILDNEETSLLHPNEPTQNVTFDTSRSSGENYSYNLIGTYKSPRAYYSNDFGTQEIEKIINEMLIKGEISVNDVYPEGFYRSDEDDKHYSLTPLSPSNKKINKATLEKYLRKVASAINQFCWAEGVKLINKIKDFEELNDANKNMIIEELEALVNDVNLRVEKLNKKLGTRIKKWGIGEHLIDPVNYLQSAWQAFVKNLFWDINTVSNLNCLKSVESKRNFIELSNKVFELTCSNYWNADYYRRMLDGKILSQPFFSTDSNESVVYKKELLEKYIREILRNND